MAKLDPLETDDDTDYPLRESGKSDDYLPAIVDSLVYELEPFVRVDEAASDKECTISDLGSLNNHLAICSNAILHVRSISSLCSLTTAVCKLIETRRKVKKLPFGEPAAGKSGRVYEILE